MKVCVVWNLHQPNGWHPAQHLFSLPWTRVQTLRSYLPLLDLAEDFPNFPLTIAISPDVLRQLEHCTHRAGREAMLELHRKAAADLRPADITDLASFAFDAASEALARPYPVWNALWQRWQANRGILPRFIKTLQTQELQDLQVLSQLCWLDEKLQARVPHLVRKASAGEHFTAADAHELVDLQLAAMGDFLLRLRQRCQEGRIEYLGAPLHRVVSPLLCGTVEDFRYPEDLRAQIVRGPRVHYQNFGVWPSTLWLPEGALCEGSASLLPQACLHRAVASSRVLARSLGRIPTEEEAASLWDFQGRELLFTQVEICDQIRFVYPHLEVAAALRDLRRRIEHAAEANPDPNATLVLEVEASIGAAADPAKTKDFWRGLMTQLSQKPTDGSPGACIASTIADAVPTMPRRSLENIEGYTRRPRGFASWCDTSRPLYWRLLCHAREQFQNVRAWKTLAPERLTDAKASLFVLESADWIACMEAGLDAFTQRKTEELFRAHLECVYRSLDIPRPPAFAEPIFPCDEKVTSIGPSQEISPVLDGKTTSYHTWNGSGFYRTREEGGCSRDTLRRLDGVYFGSDSVNVYVRVALPIPAREMLEDFEIQGVMHANEGEQTVSWFRISRTSDGQTRFDTRLAVPPNGRDQDEPLAAIDDVADFRLPLSSLGVRLGEILRFQVSLWEHGNAVASAPTLGWEEFLIGDHVTYEGDTARGRAPVDWGVAAR